MRSARFSRGFSDYQIKMAFIMPTMILLILMNIFPLLWSLYLSFHRYKASMPNRPAKFIGVQNYARLLTDPEIWGYFKPPLTLSYSLSSPNSSSVSDWRCSSIVNFDIRGL